MTVDMGGLKLTYDQWRHNVTTNMARGLPEMHQVNLRNAPPICICASGSSLREHLGALKKMRKRGSQVMALNRAYGFLVNHGIEPDLFAAIDPGEAMVEAVKPARSHTLHLLASQMHPSVFDALKGKKVAIWHCWSRAWVHILQEKLSPEVFARVNDPNTDPAEAWKIAWESLADFQMPVVINGGAFIGLQALAIATFLGHFNIHLFGFDGCIRGGRKHARAETGDAEDVLDLDFYGRRYTLDAHLSVQAAEFRTLTKLFGHKFNLTFHGRGLLSEIWEKEAA